MFQICEICSQTHQYRAESSTRVLWILHRSASRSHLSVKHQPSNQFIKSYQSTCGIFLSADAHFFVVSYKRRRILKNQTFPCVQYACAALIPIIWWLCRKLAHLSCIKTSLEPVRAVIRPRWLPPLPKIKLFKMKREEEKVEIETMQ